jgi:hypothetical protein
VKFLHLDPKRDFRFADLSGIDFSNSNIKGFDFTGADLRGATGINVQWDSTTILKGADTSDSLFAYKLSLDQFLAQNPASAKQVNRLSKAYWPNAILGVEKLLSDKADVASIFVAKAVFEETRDLVVRSNILFFMKRVSDSADDHRHFIYNIFASHSNEPNIIRAGIRALSELYTNHFGTLNVLMAYLDHKDETLRIEALKGILRSTHLHAVLDRILARVTTLKDGTFRRTFLGRVAHMAGRDYVLATTDTGISNFIDFIEPISERKMSSIAQNAIIKERIERRNAAGPSQHLINPSALVNVKESDIVRRARRYRRLLEQLKAKYKIPFKFEWEDGENETPSDAELEETPNL